VHNPRGGHGPLRAHVDEFAIYVGIMLRPL
jgi:hypothetical protein